MGKKAGWDINRAAYTGVLNALARNLAGVISEEEARSQIELQFQEDIESLVSRVMNSDIGNPANNEDVSEKFPPEF